jgi:hypothetical protein
MAQLLAYQRGKAGEQADEEGGQNLKLRVPGIMHGLLVVSCC